MSRNTKSGLEFFPVDIDIDQDDKVYYIVGQCGEIAFGRLLKLLAEIYRAGYYKLWTEEEEIIFAGKKGIPLPELRTMVAAALHKRFFDPGLYERFQVLTSVGIQRRYLIAAERRKHLSMHQELLLVSPSELSPKAQKALQIAVGDIIPLNAAKAGPNA